jgi:HAE1 family hydrophobic/amphiphilic exporter-1
VNPADSPILLLAATSETMPLTDVDDNVETKLAQQISQVPGVAQVTIGGQQKPAIRIQLDPAKLVAKGSSLEDVRTPLSVATVDEPKGAIDSGARSFTIYTNDQLVRAKDWNDTIVAYRNGAPLRVSDIGQAVIGPQTPIRRPGRTASGASSSSSTSSRAQMSSIPWTRSWPISRASKPRCRRRSKSSH